MGTMRNATVLRRYAASLQAEIRSLTARTSPELVARRESLIEELLHTERQIRQHDAQYATWAPKES